MASEPSSPSETPPPTTERVFPADPRCMEADGLLQATCIGHSFDCEFGGAGLPEGHPFSWRSFQEAPKADKGEVAVRGAWYRTMHYHTLHTGGFVRLCTVRGRAYWNAQNETGHVTPDWKLHFSVELEDVGAAWDVLAGLFMEAKAEIGMKACVHDEHGWSALQRGRELTVYIYRFDESYRGYMQDVGPDMGPEFHLGTELDGVYDAPYWVSFIAMAERRLAAAGVRPRGCADGDLGLPYCTYASLRNEAFVAPDPNAPAVYPPNRCGWNAAKQRCPFVDVVFFLQAAGRRAPEGGGGDVMAAGTPRS